MVQGRELVLEVVDELLRGDALLAKLLLHAGDGPAQRVVHLLHARLHPQHGVLDLGLVLRLVRPVDHVGAVDDQGHLVIHLEKLVLQPVDALGMVRDGRHGVLPRLAVVVELSA